MPIELNHTIIHAKDKRKSAYFFSEILGLPEPQSLYHFLVVRTSNHVSLDFLETEEEFNPQHYAFLVSEKEFDEIFSRIQSKGLPFWADPAAQLLNQINTRDGGRGLYFEDPSGHYLEILTKPYGSGNQNS